MIYSSSLQLCLSNGAEIALLWIVFNIVACMTDQWLIYML